MFIDEYFSENSRRTWLLLRDQIPMKLWIKHSEESQSLADYWVFGRGHRAGSARRASWRIQARNARFQKTSHSSQTLMVTDLSWSSIQAHV